MANYAGIHSAQQVMRLFDLEGKGYLTISQLRNFKRFLIQTRVTVPDLPSAETDRSVPSLSNTHTHTFYHHMQHRFIRCFPPRRIVLL